MALDQGKEVRRAIKDMPFYDSFETRLGLVLAEAQEENEYDRKISHVFDTIANVIFSAFTAGQNKDLDISSLSLQMQQRMKLQAISAEQARELLSRLKDKVSSTFGESALPVMISLWDERAGVVGKAIAEGSTWLLFTQKEREASKKRLHDIENKRARDRAKVERNRT